MCGLAGVFLPESAPSDAAVLTALALQRQQHRGQDAAGIMSFGIGKNKNKERFHSRRGLGLVGDIFTKKREMNKLRGNVAIGHVRYPTSGKENHDPYSIQPMYGGRGHDFAIAHNGNIPDGARILESLIVDDHARLQSTVDTEIFVERICRSRQKSIEEKVLEVCSQIPTAYSLVILAPNKLIGVRDIFGVRPLVLGRLPNGGHVLASESCAFPVLGAEFVRHIAPGEMVVIDEEGVRSTMLSKELPRPRPCVFEHVYFSRPDSLLENGEYGLTVRERLGAILAEEVIIEANINADIVLPVPNSSLHAANGVSKRSGIPLSLGMIRDNYVGRIFIAPDQKARNFGLLLKHSIVPSEVEGKDILFVDDSMVRGDTMRKIVTIARECKPRSIHVALTYPMYRFPCPLGINTPTLEELIANKLNREVEKIRKYIGVDSLHFLSYGGLIRGVNPNPSCPYNFCDGCATGNYPRLETH